ncbi:hypothetical protein PAXRUDRAFT_159298 [Paxillus rubicundulus Ve08.2h10]|uniref:Uncharacterized protein n=1 Tax=Paxillus rubicundulus Ve08.2h10 TaxID=930991 RepID=A0A0D0CX99_9AGAM|nr:hypothetical protein PAXRUDRAFT_159298 [Paxillus rubicundulus Ve08.2h10]
MVFCWVFIPWLQEKLNNYQTHVNCWILQAHPIFPHGVPELVHSSPKDHGALNFKISTSLSLRSPTQLLIECQVKVTPAAISHVHELYINSTHAMFNLLPSSLSMFIELYYDQLGHPSVEMVQYLDLLGLLWQCAEIPPILKVTDSHVTNDDKFPLLPGLQELSFNKTDAHYYMGGVGNSNGLCEFFFFPFGLHFDATANSDTLSNRRRTFSGVRCLKW